MLYIITIDDDVLQMFGIFLWRASVIFQRKSRNCGATVQESGDFRHQGAVDDPTVAVLAGCYLAWAAGTTILYAHVPLLGFLLTLLATALHASLQHEALHGHPTRMRWLNEALVFPALGLCFPYGRFRDLHLAHHHDEFLTDPYDDPESNYLDPAVWQGLPRWRQRVLRFNNLLIGRMLVGPAVGLVSFVRADLQAIRNGDLAVLRDWLLHLAGVALVLWWLIAVAAMPVWAYLLAAYGAMSVLKIRTYLEHRAHELARGRTVIIEGGGLLPFLFLNNNLHVVHHMRPAVAWYKLPALYRDARDDYQRRNDGYVFRSYAEVFRRFFLKAKDPVPHPLWRGRD